jgi:VWFA-related protein
MKVKLTNGLKLAGSLACLSLLFTFSATAINAQQATPSPSPQGDSQVGENETVRIETDLVDLNVTIFSHDPKRVVGLLEQKDFRVLEDGVEQEISLFASAEAPFDLVLLIDLSASTKDKLKLIRNSAAKFVEAARRIDRIAIVTFTDKLDIVSPLTFEREELKTRIKNMQKPFGGTNFWDALRYVVETMLNPERIKRRTAVVMMTDGVDNALPDVPGEGSRTGFEELLRMVGSSDSILIPIYLDTEREMIEERRIYSAHAYQLARHQLGQLASESGSKVYYARKVEDLKDSYQQVIRDLSTVYSIGYRPSNKSRDGSWRSVNVRLNGREDVAARARRGYFAK